MPVVEQVPEGVTDLWNQVPLTLRRVIVAAVWVMPDALSMGLVSDVSVTMTVGRPARPVG